MKLLHCADLHVGMDAHGRLDPSTGLSSRLGDFERSFVFMVETALRESVDLFLFCGDAYRTADPTPTQQRIFARCLRPLADAGIPVVMVVGNHDHPVSFGRASALDIFEFVKGVDFVFRKPDLKTFATKSGPVQILGMPWPIRSNLVSRDEHRGKTPTEIRELIEQKYADILAQYAAAADPALPLVVAGHFSVLNAEMGGSERTSLIAHEPKFSLSMLAPAPVDYVALGHIHRRQDLANPHLAADGYGASGASYVVPNDTPVVYSSSIERISFKEEDDEKGFVLVEIDPARERPRARYRAVDTPARRFVTVRVDATAAPDATEAVLAAIARHDATDAVVRVQYRVDEAQAAKVDVKRIQEALAGAHVVAAVERTVEKAERQRRTVVTRELSLRDAMERYVAQRDDLAAVADALVREGLALEAELDGDG